MPALTHTYHKPVHPLCVQQQQQQQQQRMHHIFGKRVRLKRKFIQFYTIT